MKTQNQESAGFTLRAAVTGAGIALFLLMSSTYISLKLGALPWPIIFSVIVSGGILKVTGGRKSGSIHEINTAQSGASIGGLVAAGVSFTLPGIYLLQQEHNLTIAWPNPWLLAIMVSTAGLIGILLAVPLKYTFVDEENLPYPAGTAGAELLKLGKTGGRQLWFIISAGALAAIFALVRDVYFGNGLSFASLAAAGVFLTLLPLPLAVGGGFILGPRAGFSWFAGAAVGWFGVVPILIQRGFEAGSARAFAQNLGMGIVLGAGIGFFVSYVLPRFKQIFIPLFRGSKQAKRWTPVLVGISLVALRLLAVPWLAACMTVIGVWLTVAIAARMTGETNIDPLEQFGIFVGLVVAFVYGLLAQELSVSASFMIVTFVSVACAIAGDAGHDFKSAHIVGTRFFDIVKADIIAVVTAGLAAPLVLHIIRTGFQEQLFTPAMPAPQARLVASSIFGFEFPSVFAAGFGIGFVLELVTRFLPQNLRNNLLLMPFGIGLFLGLGLAIPIALGAVIRVFIDRRYSHLYQAGLVLAAGVMGGEGIAGFTAGAVTVAGVGFATGALILVPVFSLILIFAFFRFLATKRTTT